jgi:pyruvate dehydrogenase E2 component (dihydrolipoamide acetyltransferase)
MQASYQEAPHITFTNDVDMSAAIALREYANRQLPDAKPRVSMTALIVKICAWALGEHPLLNSHLVDDQIITYPRVNMGVAVALEEGLIVPVLPDAGAKGLLQIAEELDALVERVRTNSLHAADLAGGTFTISNLGMFGIDRFTAILNPPEVGILAVGRTVDRFVPDEQRQPVLRPVMTITLSVDHRVIDGATAAQFMTTLREALEAPSRLLL